MNAQAGARRFDSIVLGAGPGGEAAVSALTARGMKVALVERELIGGECAYWACIPSKTLLRVPEVRAEARRVAGTSEPGQDWAQAARYRDYMIRDLDDAGEIASYENNGAGALKSVTSLN